MRDGYACVLPLFGGIILVQIVRCGRGQAQLFVGAVRARSTGGSGLVSVGM